jgi:hypothetical protein
MSAGGFFLGDHPVQVTNAGPDRVQNELLIASLSKPVDVCRFDEELLPNSGFFQEYSIGPPESGGRENPAIGRTPAAMNQVLLDQLPEISRYIRHSSLPELPPPGPT